MRLGCVRSLDLFTPVFTIVSGESFTRHCWYEYQLYNRGLDNRVTQEIGKGYAS